MQTKHLCVELWVGFAPLNRLKPSSKIFYWPFQGGTSFVDLLCFCSGICSLCLCARLFLCALWSPAGKGLTSWLSFVVSNCEFVTFPLVSWVRCGTWLYRFLIFAPYLLSRPLIALCKSKVLQNAPIEHSAIHLIFIKLPFVNKIFVLSSFEWPLKMGFTSNKFISY